jgi:hypothetical protein
VTELFRFIEQAFALPTPTDAIDAGSESNFQTSLRNAISQQEPPDSIRNIANEFLDKHFPTAETRPFALGNELLSFSTQLIGLASPTERAVNQLVKNLFDSDAPSLVTSTPFAGDKELLSDALVAVKLVTGFDRVNAADLVAMRQAVAFLEDLAGGVLTDFTAGGVQTVLTRPIRIPKLFINALTAPGTTTPRSLPDPAVVAAEHKHASLLADQQAFQSAYETIMAVQPHEFELKPATSRTSRMLTGGREAPPAAYHEPARHTAETTGPHNPAQEATAAPDSTAETGAAPTVLALSSPVINRLGTGVQRALQSASVDIANAPVTHVIASIKRQWQDVSRQLAPYQVPAASPVFRVGVHLFTLQDAPGVLQTESATALSTLFRRAITRPVGIGDLQVVRQELIGYEASEISHIENVLEGELLRRSTRREEVNELTITQETDTTQVEERDQQSTSRNELSSEAQKEATQQTTSVKDQTTTTDYGKLVENSKTNYARSVTDRAVNTLTQMVKLQRVQREKKSFTEEALHELDNRQNPKKVRGIYQWVDKKYKARILNYGKRLLYDVVVPEPGAFLIESLKNAVQPESFQLTKPVDPAINPSDLDPSNYSYYATQYGVTGSVTPPPDEFVQTVGKPDSQDLKESIPFFWETVDAAGATIHNAQVPRLYFAAFNLRIPDNYKALSGYIQRVNFASRGHSGVSFEFFLGESYFVRFGPADVNTLNSSFTMNGETGDIPVTMRSFANISQFNYAIGINCQRTDKAYEQWQLKTHATIVQGYQRQLADYQDKLNQYTAAVRSQIALAQNFAHDPSIEQEELKKAFIFLLLGEHYAQAFHPTPNPGAIPPNPTVVRDWGAMVAFFERAFEWENIMYTYYPYFWGRQQRWAELILIQDTDPQFEAFLKAGAARVVIPVRPGFEAALAHYQETGDIWMGEEIPDMFSDFYVSIIEEIKARNFAPGKEICVAEWDVKLPTTLVILRADVTLPEWKPTVDCSKAPVA